QPRMMTPPSTTSILSSRRWSRCEARISAAARCGAVPESHGPTFSVSTGSPEKSGEKGMWMGDGKVHAGAENNGKPENPAVFGRTNVHAWNVRAAQCVTTAQGS